MLIRSFPLCCRLVLIVNSCLHFPKRFIYNLLVCLLLFLVSNLLVTLCIDKNSMCSFYVMLFHLLHLRRFCQMKIISPSTVPAQRTSPQTPVVAGVDNSPGFQFLRHDPLLSKHHLSLDYGRVKNINCNPFVEKAVRELGSETPRFNSYLVELLDETLALITSQVNSRVCNPGLSAWEMLRQIDQCSGLQLPLFDEELAPAQLTQCQANHTSRSIHKACGGPPAKLPFFNPGSLVYFK